MLAEPRAQRLPFQALRHDVGGPVVLADIVNRHDVLMVECADRARFALKCGEAFVGIGWMWKQQFDRDVAREPLVARSPHLAGASGPELMFDRIVADAIAGLDTPSLSRD